MKQILSTLMLCVMLIVGIQPTMSMHYCAGHIRSIGMHVPPKTAKDTSCCESHHMDSHCENMSDTHVHTEGCCDNSVVHISTDDFQQQNRQISLDQLSPIIIYNLLFSDLLDNSTFEHGDVNNRIRLFPEKGLAYTHIDLLALNCTYLI